uniref:CSON013369 protein n=1 Tax=Culicoides sonorensis TaxID=179676 RepID=A0A336M7U2_CULSO
MQLYTEPQICANQPSIQEKNLKQRALDFLKRRIECETLNRPKFVTSLASSILIGAKHHFDRDIVTPSQTIFICQLKWNGAKFNGSGMKKCDALENASIAAVNALFGLNLKSLIPPCCSKLNDSFIKKIKIEEIYKNSVAEKVFVMSVNLPGSGKKISAESFSQNNATEILYNMAMEAYIKDELLKIERYNVKILVKFFQNNASHIESNTENVERIFERKMRKEYLEKGLEWIKKNLDKDSFVKITPEDLLEHFLPNSEITITECSCTVKFSDHKWSATLSSGLEAKEVVVNEIMKELFDIDLVPYHCENLPELQKQLKEQLDGKTIKVTARNPLTAEKLTVAQALNVIQEKYKEEVLTLNRKSFSKFFVNENSPLVDRVEFVLNHFSFQNIHGKSRFEPVIWLLNVFERTLLDKIDKSIHIEVYFNNQYKAVTIMNNKEISCLNTSKVQARRDLIVKAIKESEEIKDPITIICKASLYQHAKNELKAITSSTDPKPDITSPKIEFYKNKVLDLIYSEREIILSPTRMLTMVLAPDQFKILRQSKCDTDQHQVTIEFCGIHITGIGANKKEAQENACLLAIKNVLEIDWNLSSQGLI